MKINSIDSANNPTFTARLACGRSHVKNFLNSNSIDLNSKEMVIKIANALEKHPSDAVVKIDIIKKSGFYGTRGSVTSRFATYKDVEPVQNDGKTPIKNILRRILDPENKDCFNKLVGEKHSNIYNTWWNENIAPIWNEINENFRSKAFFKGNHDKEFNRDFQNRKEKTWYNLINEQV